MHRIKNYRNLMRKIFMSFALAVLTPVSVFAANKFSGSMGGLNNQQVGIFPTSRGGGVTYATVGATIHKIDIDPVTGGGSNDPDVAQKPDEDVPGNDHDVPHHYSRDVKVTTSRSASYQAIYNADLRELNKVTVENGAYGSNGPIKYGPDDVNYNSVSAELLINGKKLETPTAYSDSYSVHDEDHIDWPETPVTQSRPEITTDDAWSAEKFLSHWNLQEDADTTELLTVTSYSDKIVINGKTYLDGSTSTSHDAFHPAQGPREINIENASVTSNTGSGGHYLQRNNNTVVNIPEDVKNGTYATKLTLSYARMIPRDGNIKDTISNGVAAILNESMYGQNFKGRERTLLNTFYTHEKARNYAVYETYVLENVL